MSVISTIKSLRDSGVETRETVVELLIQVAEEAWRLHPGQAKARRAYVRAELCDDPTWIVLEKVQPQALVSVLTWLLGQANQRREEVAARAANGGGHPTTDTQRVGAPATNEDHARETGRGSESARRDTTPKPTAPTAPPDRTEARLRATLWVHNRLYRLDTVLIDGVPIGDCTVRQVREWAVRRKQDMREAGRDVRFALALVSTLPSSAIIREYWRDHTEVDALYDKAEIEYGA